MKCFITALNLIHEKMHNKPSSLAAAKIIYSLFNNSKGFLDIVNKIITQLQKAQENNEITIKNQFIELEKLKIHYESRLEHEKNIHQGKASYVEFNKLKEKYGKLQFSSANERNNLLYKIDKLEEDNEKMSKRINCLEANTDVSNMTKAINELRNELCQYQNAFQSEKDEKDSLSFKFYNILDAKKKEMPLMTRLSEEHIQMGESRAFTYVSLLAKGKIPKWYEKQN